MLKGGCLCGGVRYEVDAAITVAGECHCTRCQRVSGGASVAGFIVAPDKFQVVAGEDLLGTYVEEGFTTRHHCTTCGSGVFGSADEFVVVHAGSLEDGSAFESQFHMMVDHKAPWDEINDDLPQFGGLPPMG